MVTVSAAQSGFDRMFRGRSRRFLLNVRDDMIARQIDAMAELQSAFQLLLKNITLAVVPIVAMFVCGLFFVVIAAVTVGTGAIAGGFNNPGALMGAIGGGLIWFGIAGLLSIVVSLIANASVIASSENVWQGRPADLGAGVSRALSKLGDLVIAGLVLGIIAVLVGWTLIGGVALGFLMMFVPSAIVVGDQRAFEAMGTSWRLTTQNFAPSFSAFLGLIVAGIAAGIINLIVGHILIVGQVIALIVFGFVIAYASLVTVRFYNLLTSGSAPAVAASPPPASPTT